MAFVDDDGLLWPEPQKGDVLRVAHVLRKDYGALVTPGPLLIVHHTTGRWMPDGQLTFPLGMVEIGKRVAKRPAYASLYVGRDGQAVQVVRYGRSCVGASGKAVHRGKAYEINRVSFQVEWDNWGWCDRKGGRGAGAPTVNPKRRDAVANDPKQHPGNYWQDVPVAQAQAVAEVCLAVVSKSQMRPIDALHGHYEVSRASHVDPGPVVIRALETVVAKRLGLPEPTIAPARNIAVELPIVLSALEVA